MYLVSSKATLTYIVDYILYYDGHRCNYSAVMYVCPTSL
jgi:hypothetical protein